jgi:hypothetical protein
MLLPALTARCPFGVAACSRPQPNRPDIGRRHYIPSRHGGIDTCLCLPAFSPPAEELANGKLKLWVEDVLHNDLGSCAQSA